MNTLTKRLASCIALSIVLSACGGDDEKQDVSPVIEAKLETVQIDAVAQEEAEFVVPEVLFERYGYDCMQAKCEHRKVAKSYRADEFGKNIPNWTVITIGEKATGLTDEIRGSYKGYFESQWGNSIVQNVNFHFVHLHPGKVHPENEYEVYFLTGMDGKVLDWGGRARCAPLTPDTLWQTTPC